MLLFVLAAVMSLGVGFALALPLLRPLGAPTPAEAFNAGVYRDQLGELERDVERGVLGEQEAGAARREIERRLIATSVRPVGGESAPAEPARVLAAVLAIGVAAMAGAIYFTVGQPLAGDHPLRTRDAADGGGVDGDAMHAQMDDLVRQLAEKLKERPNDATGWALMARSLMRLERADEAIDAYKRAIALTNGTDGALASEYAEARVIAGNGVVDPEARGIFEHMLRVDPTGPQARYYLALAKAQHGDAVGALSDWRALLADTPTDAPWRETLERQIANVSGETAPASAPPPGPTVADVDAAGAMSATDRSAMIEGMVTQLAARLKDNPNDLAGWRRLARAYGVLDRRNDATRAYERVLALAPNDPDALWALGVNASARGDVASARRSWRALEKVLPASSPERARVVAAIEALPTR